MLAGGSKSLGVDFDDFSRTYINFSSLSLSLSVFLNLPLSLSLLSLFPACGSACEFSAVPAAMPGACCHTLEP